MTRLTYLVTVLILLSSGLHAQKKQYKIATVGFYNVENLFDTIETRHTRDEDFTPAGKHAWTTERYYKKLDKLSEVISQIGDEYLPGGPMILGVSEIENGEVLEDLANTARLKNSNYGVIHYHSPDRRGIDVGLMYRKDFFNIISSKAYRTDYDFAPERRTRDQLVVKAEYENDTMHFIVNHWPSPGGGKKVTDPMRDASARLSKKISDSIRAENPNAKIFIMGDLNTNPDSDALVKHLGAKGNKNRVKDDEFYNPYYDLFKKGIGSNAYRDAWSLFDQIVMSKPLLSDDRSTFVYWKSYIFSRPFMIEQEGRFKGYPKRTFSFDRFQNGYSDHFPVYVVLIKEI